MSDLFFFIYQVKALKTIMQKLTVKMSNIYYYVPDTRQTLYTIQKKPYMKQILFIICFLVQLRKQAWSKLLI